MTRDNVGLILALGVCCGSIVVHDGVVFLRSRLWLRALGAMAAGIAIAGASWAIAAGIIGLP